MGGQLWAAALLLGAVGAAGLAASARARRALGLPLSTTTAIVPVLGVGYVGIVTLVVGHVGLIGRWLPYALAVVAVAAALADRRLVGTLLGEAATATRHQARRFSVQSAAVGLGLVLATWSALAPPNRTDEIEYHWPAALDWAAAGAWSDSPYRHVDGFPLMEVVYTAAATHGSYVAAHLLHLTTLLALGLAAAGTARSMGVSGTGAVFCAAVAMPVAWDQAYAAYNDTAAGAFGAAAAAVVLGSARSRLRGTLLASGILALAISIKPTATGAVGLVALILLMLAVLRKDPELRSASRLFLHWGLLVAAALSALVFWSMRQWLMTGNLVDPGLGGPASPDAAARLPDATQQAIAPLMPLVTGVVGAQEPWGGRTSLVVQLLLVPALLYVIWARGSVLRRFAVLAVPAYAHWVVVGLLSVRTRFHIVSWALLVASVRVGVEDAATRWPRAERWLELVWTAGVVLGVVDVSFEMVRLIRATWFPGW
jgi:hypothetical protein